MKLTYQTGIAGEIIAENWLQEQHGMRSLERRFRTKAGEIDLIMQDGDTLVFVEVKTRMNASPGTGLLAVDRRKQKRLANAARLYLILKGYNRCECRFDVIEVSKDDILYIPNAFQPGGLFYN